MNFNDRLSYSDKKMGVTYSKQSSLFRVWAPSQKTVTLCIYQEFNDQERQEYDMVKDENGVFECLIEQDLDGKFYNYLVKNDLVTDPYSYACSVNSNKSAIVDLENTNPLGFENHKIPNNDRNKAIIVEAHVADISILDNSGAKNRGTFLGLVEEGTKYEDISTCIDHLKELGATHLHLMPVTDYLTVDETKPLRDFNDNYNWGYDQELYSCLEGSYSTNPYDPKARIIEFKQMVQKLHENGISVVLDVVYNHTYRTKDSNFNILVPNYYYRNVDGNFYNGSGCGNEFNSDSPMGRKFIVDSLCFLAKEYKIDGFRFDLMALIDIDTIMLVKEELEKINPNILIYGEPWMAQGSLLDYEKQINIGSQKSKGFAIFNPFFRDNLKGDNDGSSRGYLQGEYYLKNEIQKGIVGSINFKNYQNSNFDTPLETINYFNAHDNLIFYDKLIKSNVFEKNIKGITIMAFSILMFSQGYPFFHLGNEFLRTKKMNHNSYNSSTEYNGIDWSLKKENFDIFTIISDTIKFRKKLGLFNMKTAEEVNERINFIENLPDYIIAFTILEGSDRYLIVHNVSDKKEIIDMDIDMTMIWENGEIDTKVNKVEIRPFTTNIYRGK